MTTAVGQALISGKTCKMKTCCRCGCYIPDNWTRCPACSTSGDLEKKTHQRLIDRDMMGLAIYTARFQFDYSSVPCTRYFGAFDEAFSFCEELADIDSVDSVELYRNGEKIGTYYKY